MKETGQSKAVSALSARIQGRVQGVGFRYSCIQEALRIGLTGWVRNTPEGDVEIWAEGQREKLEHFLQWLRRGPPIARVDAVDWDMPFPTGVYTSFSIEH